MKNILIGFLGASCIFLMIGATSDGSGRGKYQAFADGDSHLLMIDTHTGELYKKRIGIAGNKVAWNKVSGADWAR